MSKRAEYRRLKNAKEVKYSLTLTQLNAMIKEGVDKRVKKHDVDLLIKMLGVPSYVLHNNFGYGKKRLEKFIDEMLDHLKLFQNDEVTIEDYKALLKDECGIDIWKK